MIDPKHDDKVERKWENFRINRTPSPKLETNNKALLLLIKTKGMECEPGDRQA